MLRIDSTTHHLVNETSPRELYTINENIVRLPFPAKRKISPLLTPHRIVHRHSKPISPGMIPSADGRRTLDYTTSSSTSPCSTHTSVLLFAQSQEHPACTAHRSASPTATACSSSSSITVVVDGHHSKRA